jgi:hypothetical protein
MLERGLLHSGLLLVEAQISAEVLRHDESGSPVHHEGGAGEEAMSIPRRAIDRSQDRGRQGADCRGAATAVASVPRRANDVLRVLQPGSDI